MIRKIFSRLTLAFTLAADFVSVVRILHVAFIVPIKRKIFGHANTLYKIVIKKFGRTCDAYIRDGSDIGVLYEMFVEEQYAFTLNHEPQSIFDLGSNTGLSVLYFKLRYPKARVYACEADPQTVKLLKKNVAQFDDVTVFAVAVGDSNTMQKFYVYPGSSMSSSLVPRAQSKPIDVPVRTLKNLMEEANVDYIDLLKFDIEGAEYQTFKVFDTIQHVRALIGEIHLDLIGRSKQEMLDLLKGFNIKEVPINNRRFIVKAWR